MKTTSTNNKFINNSKTKLFMKTKTFFAFFVIALFGLFLTGCQQDDVEPVKQEQTELKYEARIYELTDDPERQKELQFMKEQMNLSPRKIEIDDSGYIFDKDMYFSRENLKGHMKSYKEQNSSTGNISAKHRKYTYMSRTGAITVYSHSSLGTGWPSAISGAISAWNGLGLTVSFGGASTTSTYNTNAITIRNDASLPSGVVARAEPPASNGYPGYQIRVNPSFNSLHPDQKKFIIAHEIGHCLGFLHTNSSDGTAINSWDYGCVPLSCDGTDASSVLKAGGSGPTPYWSTFSYCDKQVFQCLYWSLA